MTASENIRDIMSSIFDRKGGQGIFTKRYESFSTAEQKKILDGVILNRDELPIVAGDMPDNCRMIITTERVLQFDGDVWSTIILSEILEVTPREFGTVRV